MRSRMKDRGGMVVLGALFVRDCVALNGGTNTF